MAKLAIQCPSQIEGWRQRLLVEAARHAFPGLLIIYGCSPGLLAQL
jgi:hypothetical protein